MQSKHYDRGWNSSPTNWVQWVLSYLINSKMIGIKGSVAQNLMGYVDIHIRYHSKAFFKRTISQDFYNLVFFCQSAPHGPVWDVLGPFWILTIIHGDIWILNRLPGVLYTGELWLPRVLCTQESQLGGVLCTGELHLWKTKILDIVPSTGESGLCGVLCTAWWVAVSIK